MNLQTFDNGVAAPPSQSHGFVGSPTLPDRHVNSSTIEDAYVSFIFYCNPALPLDSDTESLREAFRTPPKSGGKVFSTFAVFELVRKFYQREIKTWTELTTTLGVEPPDLAKDESAQKVAQYGVRLKKWMNSMHVRAFFEYLMSIPNDYWTRIPNDANPVAIAVRDGVAVEDDMALRALLPHIRPKRGRKRPEGDDGVASPAQRPRPSSPSALEDHRQGPPPAQPWSAYPDARPGIVPMDPSRAQNTQNTQNPTAWAHNESLQTTPVSRWPRSAVTPSTRGSFWDDALEPRSAVTPVKGKMAGHRRGAKNVSSAWKAAGQDAGTRSRGRPPLNRTPVDGSGQYPSHTWTPAQETSENTQFQRSPPPPPPPPPPPSLLPQVHTGRHPRDPAASGHHLDTQQASPNGHQETQTPHDGPRPARPSISLQVPERSGGSVRLATPPALMPYQQAQAQGKAQDQAQAHGCIDATRGDQFNGDDSKYQDGWRKFAKEATAAYEQKAEPNTAAKDTGLAADGEIDDFYFDKMRDRTNIDVLVAYFTRSMAEADWRDNDGKPTRPVDFQESTAMVHAMLQTMYKTAISPQAFLINLAALAGSTTLVMTRPKCTRLSEQDGQFTYKCEWEYQFGQVKGGFTFEQVVPATMWAKAKNKTPPPPPPSPPSAAGSESGSVGRDNEHDKEQLFSREYWQRKYEELTVQMMNRDKDLADLKDKVMAALGRGF